MDRRSALRIAVAIGLLALATAPPTSAQTDPVLVETGSTVRAQTPSGFIIGTALSVSPDMIVVEQNAGEAKVPRRISSRSLQGLQVRLRDRTPQAGAWRGVKIGLLYGAGISAVLIAAGAVWDARNECADCWITATGLAIGVSVPLLSVMTVGGAVIGWFNPGGRWTRGILPKQDQFGVSRGHEVGLRFQW